MTEDKLLQTAAGDILMAIFEQDFLPSSFGYRPNVGAVDAAGRLAEELYRGGCSFAVETDIKGCFNSISHEWMLEMLKQRVDDEPFLGMIRKRLKAGVLEEDKRILKPELGTPQGGSISPISADVYLHYAFDLWFERAAGRRMRGKVFFVRYADDSAPRRRIVYINTVHPCCASDEGRPLEAAVQAEASNYRKLRRLSSGVVSVTEKAGQRSRQVRVRETNASEPLMTCRKRMGVVKTGGGSLLRDKFGRDLFTVRAAAGMKAA